MTGSNFDSLRTRATRAVVAGSLLGLLAVLAACGDTIAQQSTPDPAAIESPPPTAIVVSAVNAPIRLAGSDGLVHLEYDLQIVNAFTAPVTLTSITVLGEHGESLLQLSGAALAHLVEPILGTSPLSETEAVVPVSGSVAVVVDVPVGPGVVPARLSHRIAYTVPPNAPAVALIGSYDFEGPALDVSRVESVTLAPPLRGTGWLSLNGCCGPNAHRSLRNAVGGTQLLKPETFAIDYVQLRNGLFFSGDGSANAQHYAYGAELLAVADGEVVFVRGDMPAEQPFTLATHVTRPVDYAGNQVVLRIGDHRWAIYGHMQAGSATVQVGDKVRAGQVLGLLGNSGNTTAPHLHFEVIDNPVNTSATSVPFVFTDFVQTGYIMPDALVQPPGPNGFPILGSTLPQHLTHPLWLTISTF